MPQSYACQRTVSPTRIVHKHPGDGIDNPPGCYRRAKDNHKGNAMNSYQKYFLLLGITVLGGVFPAFAASSAPSLGAASRFAVLSAAPAGGGAVTCTGAIINGDVGSSGLPVSVVQTEGCVITGAIVAPVSA